MIGHIFFTIAAGHNDRDSQIRAGLDIDIVIAQTVSADDTTLRELAEKLAVGGLGQQNGIGAVDPSGNALLKLVCSDGIYCNPCPTKDLIFDIPRAPAQHDHSQSAHF